MAITAVLCDAGKTVVAELIRDETSNTPIYIAIGTGTTAAAATDTVMETESYRVTGTTATVSATQMKITGSITITGSATITELAAFDASSGGNIFYHGIESSGDAVVTDDIYVFDLSVTVAQGSF